MTKTLAHISGGATDKFNLIIRTQCGPGYIYIYPTPVLKSGNYKAVSVNAFIF